MWAYPVSEYVELCIADLYRAILSEKKCIIIVNDIFLPVPVIAVAAISCDVINAFTIIIILTLSLLSR